MQIPKPFYSLLNQAQAPCFFGGLQQIEDCPKTGGTYIILIEMAHMIALQKPRQISLHSGLYCYTGSAFGPGGLRARIRRHLSSDKTVRWHIDQLTIKAERLWAIGWQGGTECALVEMLETQAVASHPVAGFGSSDCTKCQSHLLAIKPVTL